MTVIRPDPSPVRVWAPPPEILPGGDAQGGISAGRGPQSDVKDLVDPLTFNSYSGADLQCMVYMRSSTWPELDGTDTVYAGYGKDGASASWKTFAELQTVTISSTRNVFPVRRLGESSSNGYTRGARTIAGTLIFSVLNRDVMAEFYRRYSGEVAEDAPFFVDQIPPFSLFIHGANEYGGVVNAALVDITLVNYGQTLSVDDLYLESTYTYVATQYFPFVADTNAFLRHRTDLARTRGEPMSARWMPPALYERNGGFDEATRMILRAYEEAHPGFLARASRADVYNVVQSASRALGNFIRGR